MQQRIPTAPGSQSHIILQKQLVVLFCIPTGITSFLTLRCGRILNDQHTGKQLPAVTACRPYALVLDEIKEENAWKNDLILFWLPASFRYTNQTYPSSRLVGSQDCISKTSLHVYAGPVCPKLWKPGCEVTLPPWPFTLASVELGHTTSTGALGCSYLAKATCRRTRTSLTKSE